MPTAHFLQHPVNGGLWRCQPYQIRVSHRLGETIVELGIEGDETRELQCHQVQAFLPDRYAEGLQNWVVHACLQHSYLLPRTQLLELVHETSRCTITCTVKPSGWTQWRDSLCTWLSFFDPSPPCALVRGFVLCAVTPCDKALRYFFSGCTGRLHVNVTPGVRNVCNMTVEFFLSLTLLSLAPSDDGFFLVCVCPRVMFCVLGVLSLSLVHCVCVTVPVVSCLSSLHFQCWQLMPARTASEVTTTQPSRRSSHGKLSNELHTAVRWPKK